MMTFFTFHVSRITHHAPPCRSVRIRLSSPHAALRISLRKMREGQRSARALHRLERHAMPALWFSPALQEIFRVRLLERQWRRRGALLHRNASFVRDVRNRPAAFSLSFTEG